MQESNQFDGNRQHSVTITATDRLRLLGKTVTEIYWNLTNPQDVVLVCEE